jgi:secreted trypsin-like serine protease
VRAALTLRAIFLCAAMAVMSGYEVRSQPPPPGRGSSELTRAPWTSEVPWSVAITGLPNNGLCSGLVLSQHFILTAAHCLEGADTLPNLAVVYASPTGANRLVYSGPAELRKHPSFYAVNPWEGADIGIISLQAPQGIDLTLTDRAEIFADAFSPWCSRGLVTRSFSIVGWGLGSNPGGTTSCSTSSLGLKRLGSGFTVDDDQCGHAYLTAEEPTNGTHRCPGDSGAPWLLRRPTRWVALAVHHGQSWQPFDIYITGTAIMPFVQWIEDTSNDLNPRYALRQSWFYDAHFVVVRFAGDDLDAPVAVALKWLTW